MNKKILNKKITIERIWAMPNKNTFSIKPINDLILNEVNLENIWLDPFANKNKLATITNDLNPEFDTDYHLDALDFLKLFADSSIDGVLYDPPYSPRQVSECYNKVGYNVTWDTTKASFWGNHKREISRIVKLGGKVITFGWNSGGIGYTYGFEISKILLVPHGGWHNDTICTVEVKTHSGNFQNKVKGKKQFKGAIVNMRSETDEKLISTLESLPIDFWDFNKSDTKEYTHGIHTYPAMMVSPISRSIISFMKELITIDSLLDPFVGSGTVLVEGMLAGINTVTGSDINPLALMLSHAKTNLLNSEILDSTISLMKKGLKEEYDRFISYISDVNDYMIEDLRLDITSRDGWGFEAHKYLQEYCTLHNLDIEIPDFKNLGYWFKPSIILQLAIIKGVILKIKDENIQEFVFVTFSELLRIASNRRGGEFKMFRKPANKVLESNFDVISEFVNLLDRNVDKMKDFINQIIKNELSSKVSIVNNDARFLDDVPDNSYDLIITSPPYGDSRTTVAYGEFSRLSLQWINLHGLTEKQIMGVDKSLMGGEKYRNGFEYLLESPTLRIALEKIKDKDLERAGDVFSFYEDLDSTIKTISKKTKTGGYHFWVVGNRTVKNILLETDKIIIELAEKHNLVFVYSINRKIPNKVMPSKNSPSNVAGQKVTTMTMEHIVILRKL